MEQDGFFDVAAVAMLPAPSVLFGPCEKHANYLVGLWLPTTGEGRLPGTMGEFAVWLNAN